MQVSWIALVLIALSGSWVRSPRPMSPKAVIEAKFAAVNRHAVADIVALYSPTARMTSPLLCAPREGRAEVQRTYEPLIATFPDITAEVNAYVVEGSRAAVIFTTTGHLRGKKFTVKIANFFTVGDGLIESDDGIYDTGGRACSL